MGKTDSTGTYSYICDGTTPGSPVLSDGHAIYTGGTSENRGGVISFRHDDNLGSVRFTTNPSQAVTANLLGDAFGEPVSVAGSLPTPLRFAGGSGCTTDADTGIVLMGHRYYDSRIGRFLSRDPAHDGGSWYAYCRNNPVSHTDPSGLSMGLPGTLGAPDQRYGGLGGALGSDAGGLFGGQSNLNTFWSSENAAMERGMAEYAASVTIQKATVKGGGDFSNIIKDLLSQIATTSFGAELLAQFTWNPHVLNITETHNPNNVGFAPQNTIDGAMYINTILFDTSLNASVFTTDGWQHISLDVALEHELGHDISYDGYSIIPDPGNGSPPSYNQNTLTGTDVESVYENPCRAELGLPLRLNHSGKLAR